MGLEPRRSPATLEAAESHLRLHIRPYFGRRPLGTISAQVVQRWQNELERRASHNLTMASRSILNRILDAAEAERLTPVNPVRKVRAPSGRWTPRWCSAGSGAVPAPPRSSPGC